MTTAAQELEANMPPLAFGPEFHDAVKPVGLGDLAVCAAGGVKQMPETITKDVIGFFEEKHLPDVGEPYVPHDGLVRGWTFADMAYGVPIRTAKLQPLSPHQRDMLFRMLRQAPWMKGQEEK